MVSVTLNIRGGKVVPRFRASLSSTILEVKEEIEGRYDIDTSRQTLRHRGVVLDNKKTLASYGLTAAKPINLVLDVKHIESKFTANVSYMMGVERNIKVKEFDTVLELKTEVAKKFKADFNRLELTCHGKKMKNDEFLWRYYVTEDTTIEAVEGSKYDDDIEDEEDSTDWEKEEEDDEE